MLRETRTYMDAAEPRPLSQLAPDPRGFDDAAPWLEALRVNAGLGLEELGVSFGLGRGTLPRVVRVPTATLLPGSRRKIAVALERDAAELDHLFATRTATWRNGRARGARTRAATDPGKLRELGRRVGKGNAGRRRKVQSDAELFPNLRGLVPDTANFDALDEWIRGTLEGLGIGAERYSRLLGLSDTVIWRLLKYPDKAMNPRTAKKISEKTGAAPNELERLSASGQKRRAARARAAETAAERRSQDIAYNADSGWLTDVKKLQTTGWTHFTRMFARKIVARKMTRPGVAHRTGLPPVAITTILFSGIEPTTHRLANVARMWADDPADSAQLDAAIAEVASLVCCPSCRNCGVPEYVLGRREVRCAWVRTSEDDLGHWMCTRCEAVLPPRRLSVPGRILLRCVAEQGRPLTSLPGNGRTRGRLLWCGEATPKFVDALSSALRLSAQDDSEFRQRVTVLKPHWLWETWQQLSAKRRAQKRSARARSANAERSLAEAKRRLLQRNVALEDISPRALAGETIRLAHEGNVPPYRHVSACFADKWKRKQRMLSRW